MTEEQRKAKRREYMRKYRIEHPEYRTIERTRAHEYRNNNLESIRARDRQWKKDHYLENRDQILQYQDRYREENRESINKHVREWYQSNLNHSVYAIEVSGKIYIGSTNFIATRMTHHKHDSITMDWKLYQAIREAGGWDQVKVHILMKDIPDKDLRIRLEQHFIDMVPDELSLNTKDAMA